MLKTLGLLLLSLYFCAAPLAAAPVSESPAPEETQPPSVDDLFRAREWKALDEALALSPELTPQELSLAANAMWYQSRWAESLEYMNRVGDRYPLEVAPYARLLSVLALERLSLSKEAYAAALNLYKSRPPSIVRYYVIYALSRFTTNVSEKEKWLRRMAESASNKASELTALRELASIGRLSAPDALALLKLEPRNSLALKAVLKAPESAEKNYRLGYAAYLAGRHDEAVKYLRKLKFNAAYGESGTYYLAMSLSRLNRPLEAEPLFEKLVFKKGGDYVARALARLSLMFGGPAESKALAAMTKAVKSKDAAVASSALYSLATSRWENAAWARSEYIRRFPGASRSADMLWQSGWEKWLEGDYEEAVSFWTRAGGGARGDAMAKLLYWRAKALALLKRDKEAEALNEWLRREHSLSIYSFLSVPGGVLKISEEPLPDELLTDEGSELERWGFMTHARLALVGQNDLASRMRRASLSLWLGQEGQAYGDLRGSLDGLLRGDTLPRALLELAYPRPYRKIVEAAGKRFGVDPLLLWSIMRQESSFDPGATSWVGAAGLMQLMPATAAGEAKRVGLKKYSSYNVSDNVTMGASHIGGLIAKFKRLDWAVAAYNGGGGSVDRWNRERGGWEADAWMESVPFRETNGYVKKVLANYEVYKKLYAAPAEPEMKPLSGDLSEDLAPKPNGKGD